MLLFHVFEPTSQVGPKSSVAPPAQSLPAASVCRGITKLDSRRPCQIRLDIISYPSSLSLQPSWSLPGCLHLKGQTKRESNFVREWAGLKLKVLDSRLIRTSSILTLACCYFMDNNLHGSATFACWCARQLGETECCPTHKPVCCSRSHCRWT